MEKTNKVKSIRKYKGIVVSDKMEKTIVVRVERKMKHPKYGKIIKSHKKYHVHDEKNEFAIGDEVLFQESKPYSKTKKWQVIEKVK